MQAKYDQIQAARREKILPYVHSDNALYAHGVSHIHPSKSDADFFKDGKSYLLNGGDNLTNGHILLQEWSGNTEGVTLIPVASLSPDSRQNVLPLVQTQDTRHNLHSRTVHHI